MTLLTIAVYFGRDKLKIDSSAGTIKLLQAGIPVSQPSIFFMWLKGEEK